MTDTFPTIPGYQILKQMGQGGMATVYLAVQESFGRQVALKIMSDQLGKDDVWGKRFMHEARIVAQLSHSNIVPVFDVGSHEGRFYISMELLKGGKLEELMTKGLSVPEVIKIICGVAAGLDYAGSKGFVHRDIKPDNVMFRDDGTPVILDFGIAKQKDGDSKMTKTGTIVGTTGYMSPEQAMGQELDERSDIYSLGVMMYELLTGYMPFHGETAVAVLLKHVQEQPPPLPANLAIFQPAMDRALAKKPADRYQRANEMIEHLQELLMQYKQQGPSSNTKTSVLAAPAVNTSPAGATIVLPSVGAPAKTTVNPALQATGNPAAVPQAKDAAPKSNKKLLPIAVGIVVVLLVLGGIAKRRHNAEQANQAILPVPVTTPTPPTPPTTPTPPASTAETPPPTAPSTEPEPTVTLPEKTPTAPETASEKKPPAESTEVVRSASTPEETAKFEKHAPPAKAKVVEQAVETPPTASPPKDNGDQQAVMRILSGAHTCMEKKQFDCAKSKAEAALDLEPDNEEAKQILASAKKAQQDAFSGDWNAK